MRITSINIPEEKINNGLKPIVMEKLGQVVLLAGKNGSGKSRILNLIQEHFKDKPKKIEIENNRKSIDELSEAIDVSKKKIEAHRQNEENPKIERISSLEKVIEQHLNDIESLKVRNNWNLIITNQFFNDYKIIRYVPKNIHLTDYRSLTLGTIESHAGNSKIIGISKLADSTLAQLRTLQQKWFESTHPNYTGDSAARKFHQENYERMQVLLETFLDVELSRDDKGEPTLFNMNLGDAKLSDGQKVLLQLCVAIHSQGASLNDIILFMDEPENHLHPSAILDVVDKIIDNIPNGQLWIATHSIALLSHFESSSIHFVEEGKVSYAGNIPEQVLESLLGDDDRLYKLQDFISLPGIMSLNQFAYESLFHPDVLMTGKDDKQVLQIKEELEKLIGKKKNKIKIMDFGAGQGRLLANIHESTKGADITDFLDYIAYDPSKEFKVECCNSVEVVYGSSEKRYYNKISSIFKDHDAGSFDVAVLCNVLHEIETKEWISIFKGKAKLQKLLSEKGAVLIVEDELMPRGEKAYQNGFIVLDTADLRVLFKLETKDHGFHVNSKKNERLKAHLMSKKHLGNISTDSIKSALISINERAKENIIEIRSEDVNYSNGRKHGFWIQQFANTSLELENYD
ncbi:AAA family ATPase [Ekhidna sp. To15]|uniref:AAA family ATPase n=1 Tax=Ekhidna sp. To15 TaxID=3395267 RepID=UPI003F522947